MKRLKYRCMFGGKDYPVHVCTAVFMVMIVVSISFPPLFIITPFIVIGAFLLCLWHERGLDDNEQELVSHLSYPLWQPVTEDIKTIIAEKHENAQFTPSQIVSASALTAAAVMGSVLLFTPHSMKNSFSMLPVGAFAALCGICVCIFMIVRKSISTNWMEMDETAVCTKIPIDHMYDITHRGRNGNRITYSYLVFYQPDGRYILPAPAGSGYCNIVLIVKYGKSLIWMPIHEDHPEELLE